ncbi:MAG TPA: cytochrome P450 [Geodermatophilus sp.]|nr:cytochrome P450 [Geodermatophilus sp.]
MSSSTGRCPVVHFDHHSQEHAEDTVGAYRELRQTHPVAWSELYGGFWVLTDYESVFEAARDDDVFSSQRLDQYGGPGLSVVIPKTPMHKHIPIELDPPEFRSYRKVVNPIASPAAVAKVEDMIVKWTTWFVDELIESGEADLAQVIGVPAICTIDWLGLPVEDWQIYARSHQATLAEPTDSPVYRRAVEVDLPYCSEQMRRTIAARAAEPQDDVISYLVQQEVDDRPITEEEVFSIVELLVSGGVGTTASLVSQALVWLYEHPDVRQELIDDPSLLDRAIEEFLRYFSPTQALARTVLRETEFHGCPMHVGDRALLAWSSANRDPAQFTDPDGVDIHRWPNRHLAFGVGVHRCAGSHFGKRMAKEMLAQVLERMPDYVVGLSGLKRYPRQGVNKGWQRIPATFTPGARRLPPGAVPAGVSAASART